MIQKPRLNRRTVQWLVRCWRWKLAVDWKCASGDALSMDLRTREIRYRRYWKCGPFTIYGPFYQ